MRALVVVAILACSEAPPPLTAPNCSTRSFFGTSINDRLDILFVIDDSPAMAPYLPALEANAPVFMNILAWLPVPPNLRIAVARGSGGSFVDPVPCGAQPGARFLEYAHSGIVRNFTGALPDVFTCLAHVGVDAATPQQPLAAAQQALAANPDFVRPNGFLFFVIITPQDDASADSPLAYFAALNGLEPMPNHVMASVVTHLPAPRLQAFVDAFHCRGTISSIDEASWANAFSVIRPIVPSLGRPCIDGVLTQPTACTFTRVQYIGTPMQREIGTLPICDPAGQPAGACGTLVPDTLCRVSGMKSVVCYNGFNPADASKLCPDGINEPADGETVTIECAVKCGP